MKSKLLITVLSLATLIFVFCDKDEGSGPGGNSGNDAIAINISELYPMGIDTLLVSPGDSVSAVASTGIIGETPQFQWTPDKSGLINIIQDPADETGTMAGVLVVAVGDSGAATKVTVKDVANDQKTTFVVKLATWADENMFLHVASWKGQHYFLSATMENWDAAAKTCKENHGHLVTINSEEEQEVVYGVRQLSTSDTWIGLMDDVSDNNGSAWYWNNVTTWTVTGEPLDYTNWDGGDPHGSSYSADYFVAMLDTGEWENQRDTGKKYILEIP